MCEYRTRGFTIDKSLLEPARLTGKDTDRIHQDPKCYYQRLGKCVSLPNIFRTRRIQDKSMKITRKGEIESTHKLKCNSSESESEFKELKRVVVEDNGNEL